MVLYEQNEVEKLLIFARDVLNSFFDKQKIEVPEDSIFFESCGVKLDVEIDNKTFEEIIFPEFDISLAENIVSAMTNVYEKFGHIDIDDIKITLTLFTIPYEFEGDIEKGFELGKDGLICDYVGYKGILFPNNRYLDRLRFLEGLCQKAKLSKDSWQNPNMQFAIFQAQEIGRVF